MKNKLSSSQIIENINARIALMTAQGITPRNPARAQLQELLTAIVKHSAGIESLDINTKEHQDGITIYK